MIRLFIEGLVHCLSHPFYAMTLANINVFLGKLKKSAVGCDE